ncbi:MAG: hypothetical protein JNN04_07175, partial [Cyclobacteriaceae bacterium]|nr:hypothetical protein [Cyclobacteriaceae bacterium]
MYSYTDDFTAFMKVIGRPGLLAIGFWLSALFLSSSALAQTATVVNNATDPRHETLNQRVVSVLFDNNLTGSTSVGQWVVRLNGSSAGITVNSAVISGNRVLVTFDASGAAGHGAGET